MIGAIFDVIGLAVSAVVGAVKVGVGAVKVGAKVGKFAAKGAWKTAKQGVKLGKGVVKVMKKSRAMARDNIPSPPLAKSYLFTKPTKAETVVTRSHTKPTTATKPTKDNTKAKVTKKTLTPVKETRTKPSKNGSADSGSNTFAGKLIAKSRGLATKSKNAPNPKSKKEVSKSYIFKEKGK